MMSPDNFPGLGLHLQKGQVADLKFEEGTIIYCMHHSQC
jgi:hypothetical protein